MELDRYEFVVSDSGMDYWFVSEGPKGKIIKLVRFRHKYMCGISYFNVAFGDLKHKTRQLDDRVVSNNKDVKKILATVSHIVLDFTERFNDRPVYAKGSTPSRTRLYQIGIIAFYQEIDKLMEVQGYINNEWQPFKTAINYEAFKVRRK